MKKRIWLDGDDVVMSEELVKTLANPNSGKDYKDAVKEFDEFVESIVLKSDVNAAQKDWWLRKKI